MFAAAPSKVPYYLAGGLLAGWAVLLAVWGVTHHGFPGSARQARLVMFTSLLLVAATITTAVATGGEAHKASAAHAAAPPPTDRTLALAADPGGALRFDRSSASVLAGRVTVKLTNQASIAHNLTIAQGTKTLGATKTITKATDSFKVQLAPGDYVFFCSVPGHRQSGMQGTLTVR